MSGTTRTGGDAPLPLVVVALDGANGDLIERWAAQGVLPNLAALMDRGSFGAVTGADCKIDHGLFVSLWSGRSRAEHGYHHFRQVDHGSYRLRQASGRDFDVEPFWAALRGSGRKVAIIDAPETALVDGLDGLQLVDWAVHEPRHPPAAAPASLLREARALFGRREVIAQHPLNGPAQNRPLLSRYLHRLQRKGRLVRALLAKDRFDLIVVGFGETHTAGHQFWNYVDRPEAFGELGDGLRSIYAAIDDRIGEIVAAAGEPSNVVVFSSVGIVDCYPTDCILEVALQELGHLVRAERPKGTPPPLALARRVLPERWRQAISWYLPNEVKEALLAETLAHGVDWSRTRAFSIPAIFNSAIRLNLKGREPQGVVEPGPEAQALLDQLERELLRLTDPKDGRPLVGEFIRTSELYGADRHPGLPDAFINWRGADRFFGRVRYGNQEWEIPAPNWFRSSYHGEAGWYVAAGPSIAGRGRGEDLDALEIAPLCLSLLGLGEDRRAQRARRKVA